MTEPDDMRRALPFPYAGNVFPPELGAVVQRTVLDGREPARIVIHDADGDWAIGDGVNDPSLPGACLVTHIEHVVAADPTIASLAYMPAGHQAERATPREEWTVTRHRYDP